MANEQQQDGQKSPAFEEVLARLEGLVEEMEKGQVSLDEMLKKFEEGMKLAATCEKMLGETRKRIEVLTEGEGGAPEWREMPETDDGEGEERDVSAGNLQRGRDVA